MPSMTMTEKILSRAAGGVPAKPGDVVVVDVETAVLMDMTFLPECWREVLKVHDPAKVAIVFDHLVPAPTIQAATAHRTGRQFASRFGIERLHDVGADQGIAHAVVADHGYALPGTVLVNADSHTCAAGAFNCAARGVGAPDMLYAVTTGKAWFRVGETIRYDFTGRLRPGVSAKDIFLHIAGTHGAHVNQNVEYGGPGMAHLSLNGRRTLATMGAELSAEFAIFEPDEVLVDYMQQATRRRPMPTMPDPGRAYAATARHRSGHAGAAGGAARCGGQQLGPGRRGRRPAHRSGVHRLLRQRHAGRSRGRGACRQRPAGRHGHAADRYARHAGDLSEAALKAGYVETIDRGRRGGHPGDLRRLRRRPSWARSARTRSASPPARATSRAGWAIPRRGSTWARRPPCAASALTGVITHPGEFFAGDAA